MPPRLCKKCSKIPFDQNLRTLRSPEYGGPYSWRFGTFGEMRVRSCPFCELVASICSKIVGSWEPLAPPDDSKEVVVRLISQGFVAQELFHPGSFVCIAGDSADEYCARATFDEFIDFDDVRRWISACHRKHRGYGDCYPTPFNPSILPRIGKRQLDFRVIDVNTMSIVYAPPRCRYIALSYVWGT
jgi:hypothetical protein